MSQNYSVKPLYENYQMLSVDDKLICFCSKKRAEWYVKRGLAKFLNEKTFKLNFEPKGGGFEHEYFKTPLENKCVCCGANKELTKHHVVPYVFRKRFPVKFKSNNHYDVLALCVDCHESYEVHATELKNKMIEEAKKINKSDDRLSPEQKKVLKAVLALEKINGNRSVPKERIAELKKIVASVDKKEVAMLKEWHNNKTESHWACEIMVHYQTEEELFEFIKIWRKHFKLIMKPKYLLQSWSEDYNHLEEDLIE